MEKPEKKSRTLERDIYSLICRNNGIKAREIAKNLKADKAEVNRHLYISPYMKELCYRDEDFQWHGMIRQSFPHEGIHHFCGFYASVDEFLKMEEEEWLDRLQGGCLRIGRNLNDTRGLFHSFKDSRETILGLFQDLKDMDAELDFRQWEIVFELRIKKGRYIRIYADILIITEEYVFSLEFKMNDRIEEEEVAQAAKYSSFLEILFGPDYNVIPVLVLTRASDLYKYVQLKNSTAEIPVCSGDMLFNIFDEYLGMLG